MLPSLRVLRLAGIVVGPALLGCNGAPADTSDSDDSTTTIGTSTSTDAGTTDPGTTAAPTTEPTTGGPAGVTYFEHVRPILANHCVHCHQQGGIAPLALDNYDDAKAFSALIASATEARQMPPYPADNSGACNTFRDARWLTDADIATLAEWHEQGALAGDSEVPPPEVPPLPQLAGEVRTLAMPSAYTPNAQLSDDYRCFIVDNPAGPNDTGYITGFDVRPGDPRIVHHVVVFAPSSPAAAAQAQAFDDEEPGPGYTCFGTAKVQAEIVAAWAPGGGATTYPDNTGMQLAPGLPLVLQVHYNTAAAPGVADKTEVDLSVATDGITPIRFVPLADVGLSLPPKQASATSTMTAKLSERGYSGPVKVHGLFPHMHTLGRTLDLSFNHDGQDFCMVDVPRWDFHWQLLYFYDEPGVVDADDVLTLNCSFDTTSRDSETHFGEGTSDEMCVAGLWVVAQ